MTGEGQKKREIKQEKEISIERFKLQASQDCAHCSAFLYDNHCLFTLHGQDTKEMFLRSRSRDAQTRQKGQAEDRKHQKKISLICVAATQDQCGQPSSTATLQVLVVSLLHHNEFPSNGSNSLLSSSSQ